MKRRRNFDAAYESRLLLLCGIYENSRSAAKTYSVTANRTVNKLNDS